MPNRFKAVLVQHLWPRLRQFGRIPITGTAHLIIKKGLMSITHRDMRLHARLIKKQPKYLKPPLGRMPGHTQTSQYTGALACRRPRIG